MANKFETNPFAPPAEAQRKRGVFAVDLRGPQSSREKALEERFREAQRARGQPADSRRMPMIFDLHAYLEKRGHTEACESVYSCDPWKYEPILYQDLGLLQLERDETQDETRKKELDGEISKLRGLIRAGSCLTYDRPDLSRDLPKFEAVLQRHAHDLRDDLASLQQQITDIKLQAADPGWIEELQSERDNLLRLKAAFSRVGENLRKNVGGENLEETVRAFDAIYGRLVMKIKSLTAAYGNPEQSLLAQLRREVDALRPVRDILYLRRTR